ncbi:MAG TPA: LysM peptidoglycan-binding domain-containing protein [Verrucomicrobiae bacterium]|nr:LysM peptidoglycan-binding domain-containing protein [Verrucomicrobiae bacterium]
MKHRKLLKFAMILVTCVVTALPARAQEQTVAQQLSILDERLSKLRADVDALQFNQQQIQQDIKLVQGQMDEVRRTGPGASANDLAALEARVKALDAARETDKKVIIDQLAKELAAMSGSHGSKAATTPATTGNEHIVAAGETLTSIAKSSGVTIADLRKANNLTSDSLKVGQKLVIPK